MQPVTDTPVQAFAACHDGIRERLDALSGLPALLDGAARAHALAAGALEFFREAIFEHHLDEERTLFPAVLQAADAAQRAQLEPVVARLVREHGELERLWKSLEPGLRGVTRGRFDLLSTQDIGQLVERYALHARFEETAFLPQAHQLLQADSGRLADLALAIHKRHAGQQGRTMA